MAVDFTAPHFSAEQPVSHFPGVFDNRRNTDSKSECYNQSEALNELSNYKPPVLVTYRFGISIRICLGEILPRPAQLSDVFSRSSSEPVIIHSPYSLLLIDLYIKSLRRLIQYLNLKIVKCYHG